MYLEQETAFLRRKYKKRRGEGGDKEQSKKHWKKPENLIIKQKYVISSL